jgi:hypothetical protein
VLKIDIKSPDFLLSFGAKELSRLCLELIEKYNFKLSKITGTERDELILKIVKRISEDKQIVGAPDRTEVWHNGWAGNLEAFRSRPDAEDVLLPKFIKSNQPIRWMKEYWWPENEQFEKNYIDVIRAYIFSEFMESCNTIYEFGAGTGHNLLAASEIYPEKRLVGTDFVQSSVDLIREIGEVKSIDLKSEIFNMLKPNQDLNLDSGSGVLTFGALEQLAGKLDNIFDYFLQQPASIYVHIEPAIELYDVTLIEDYLASLFQGRRGYSAGLVSKLKAMEKGGQIELLECRRLGFGSLMMEGYNLFVWKKK